MDDNEKPKPSATPTTKAASHKDRLLDPKLDPTWLYGELRKEINREATYDLENAAKLRAVEQGTVNYEQFRQMVLGAHLTPLDRKDKVEGCQNGKRPHVVWNTTAGGKGKEGEEEMARGKVRQEEEKGDGDAKGSIFTRAAPETEK